MDNHKPVSDRIRPILQAMERSIDSARRSRVQEPTTPLPAAPAQSLPAGRQPHSTATSYQAQLQSQLPQQQAAHHHPQQQQLLHQPQPVRSSHESLSRATIGSPVVTPMVPATTPGPAAPTNGRLKAKPKRLNSPFSSPFDQAVLRTQAG